MAWSGGRVLIVSADGPRQKLHSKLENPPYDEKNEKRPNDTEAENQAARYFLMVSKKLEMPILICEDSYCGTRMVL